MNKLMIGMLLAGAAAGSAAQTAPVIGKVHISPPPARIELPQERHNFWADEFDQVQGQYRLSNGKKMELSTWGKRIYVTIDGMPKQQLVAASPYEFVARDEKLKITIDENDPYGPHGVHVVMVVPRLVSGIFVDEVTRLVATR